MEKAYIILAGLGGGFNSCKELRTLYFSKEDVSEEELVELARDYALEEYSSYEGMHGLRSIDDIMEEEEVDYCEAEEIYQDDVETWIGYSYIEVTTSNVKEMIEEYIDLLDEEELAKLKEIFGDEK